MPTFTHLHCASAFSAHYGTTRPEVLVEQANEYGAVAAAITDRDGLYGAIRHIRACIAGGFAPIVGADLQIRNPSTGALSEVTVLAHGHNEGAGWASLSRLISAAHAPDRNASRRVVRGTATRIAVLSPDRPAAFLLGLDGPVGTVLLGPDSDVGQAVTAGDSAAAASLLGEWKRRLPGAIALEVVCHHTKPGTARSLWHAARMLELAEASQVPAVLTNAVRYLCSDDAITGDVLDSAGLLLPLGDFDPQPNGQAWLKPPAQMHALGYQIAEHSTLPKGAAERMLTATEELAARCHLDPKSDLKWRQPKTPEPEALGIMGDPAKALWDKCFAGIRERYPNATGAAKGQIDERLRAEMDSIRGFGFESYFLTVADVAAMIRQMGIRNQARGSGAGSLVNYVLRISNVDPLEHDLLFERFLGKARSTLPDIDIDVESARRHDIYRAIFNRYGAHRVTLLSMQNTYRARGASRDAGMALGFQQEQIDFVAENIWRFEARDFRTVLDSKPELRKIAALVEQDARMDLLVDVTERLDRLPRHISMHPCGVILGDSDLLSYTPTQPSGLGLAMSQFDKDDVDDVGLIKLDVLGVRMQSTMAYTLKEIVRINGAAAAIEGGLPVDASYVKPDGMIELDAIPHDDEPTFAAIRTTNTLGMFQIESPGQRELIGKMAPDKYSDLIADISLFRPGPMKGNMVAPFIDTKHGFKAPNYLHPRFKPFLQDSYGVVIYHEHVLRILHDCMGVSLAEADELRRAMEKNTGTIEQAFRDRTARNLDEHGQPTFSARDIDRIWTTLKSFGSFGFCKAHGAAFALPTYQTAWLKTHYPVEFMAGIFEHDPGMYPKRLLMSEARRMGIPILPLDVNASTNQFQVERTEEGKKGIRLSLTDVHGISNAEIDRILDQKPYQSLSDFYIRAAPSRALAVRLATIGALDSLAMRQDQPKTRGDVIAYMRHLTARKKKPNKTEHENQLPLYVDDRDLIQTGQPEPNRHDKIRAELDILATELTEHVIESYRPLLDEIGATPAKDLLGLGNGTHVLVAGIRVATQTPPMRSGKRVVFISLDDGTGCADATFFDDAQQRAGNLLFGTKLMVIQGRTRRTGERGISIQADNAWDLKQMWAQWQSANKAEQSLICSNDMDFV